MQFGSNYSQALMGLIEAGVVNVDFVKMGFFGPFEGLHEKVVDKRPILIHGFGIHEHIGMVNPKINNDWDSMNHILLKYGSKHLGVHFSIYDQDMVGVVDPVDRLMTGVQIFKEHLKVPLLLENMDYNPLYNRLCVRREAVDPKTIYRACQEYDVDLLLDTAHASVSAYHLKVDVRDYLKQLPLDRVKEIHFVGTMMTEDQGLKDMHTPPQQRDYELLTWLRDYCEPEVITLEYGWPGDKYAWRTEAETIRDHLDRIRALY